MFHRNCPGSKCPGFSSITALVSKCLEIGAEVSQSVLMPKCLVAEVSGNRRCTMTTNRLEETCWTTTNHLAENIIDEDVQPQNFGVHTAWRKAKDRGIYLATSRQYGNALLGVRHQEEEAVLMKSKHICAASEQVIDARVCLTPRYKTTSAYPAGMKMIREYQHPATLNKPVADADESSSSLLDTLTSY